MPTVPYDITTLYRLWRMMAFIYVSYTFLSMGKALASEDRKLVNTTSWHWYLLEGIAWILMVYLTFIYTVPQVEFGGLGLV